MIPQRVSAPPVQVVTNSDIESQTSTCGQCCRNINRAAGLIGAGIMAWGTVRMLQERAFGGAVGLGAVEALILFLLAKNEPQCNRPPTEEETSTRSTITCPKPSGGQLGTAVAGLATAIGLPIVIAGAVTHHERLALAGGLT